MRARERPGKTPLFLSVGVHAVGIMAVLLARLSTPQYEDFIAYEITLVSLPTVQEAPAPQPPPEEELVVETPEPVVQEEPPPVVEEKPKPVEEKPNPTPTPPPTPAEPPEEEAGTPDPSAEAGRDAINVRMEGMRRDYPAYFNNIINQMNRCMRFDGPGGLKTSVYFVIRRDGTVDLDALRFVSRSGNATFDFAVMGAVECAGNGRFGPLPEDLGWDRFPIIFDVESSRRSGAGPGPGSFVAPGHPWGP